MLWLNFQVRNCTQITLQKTLARGAKFHLQKNKRQNSQALYWISIGLIH